MLCNCKLVFCSVNFSVSALERRRHYLFFDFCDSFVCNMFNFMINVKAFPPSGFDRTENETSETWTSSLSRYEHWITIFASLIFIAIKLNPCWVHLYRFFRINKFWYASLLYEIYLIKRNSWNFLRRRAN